MFFCSEFLIKFAGVSDRLQGFGPWSSKSTSRRRRRSGGVAPTVLAARFRVQGRLFESDHPTILKIKAFII
jgi:hypothetical protein